MPKLMRKAYFVLVFISKIFNIYIGGVVLVKTLIIFINHVLIKKWCFFMLCNGIGGN